MHSYNVKVKLFDYYKTKKLMIETIACICIYENLQRCQSRDMIEHCNCVVTFVLWTIVNSK